ncbi:hypothetical protein QWY85_13775 [Neolewinella lacunae]|uniref:Uncharacterized protein n=1 Tax=Neolewinella lacunae TaxID=1517758 RepID=A0A923T6A6_9BACT|nr:hypothetical protein [Neolewinella lacunae]MBC6993220.1 hypothetical protein [Neolewinella lacunae]MDN3635733.1 hypothetical protein [Neolewinella lacunae]
MEQPSEEDLVYIRLLRKQLGQEWHLAREKVIAALPEGYDPEYIAKFVDDRPDPGIHINPYGVEPRFYPHRVTRRLLEFYRSKE